MKQINFKIQRTIKILKYKARVWARDICPMRLCGETWHSFWISSCLHWNRAFYVCVCEFGPSEYKHKILIDLIWQLMWCRVALNCVIIAIKLCESIRLPIWSRPICENNQLLFTVHNMYSSNKANTCVIDTIQSTFNVHRVKMNEWSYQISPIQMNLNMNTDELSPVGQIEFNWYFHFENRLSTIAHATLSSVVKHSQSIIEPLHLFLFIANLGTYLDLADDNGVRCIQDQRLWIFWVMFHIVLQFAECRVLMAEKYKKIARTFDLSRY